MLYPDPTQRMVLGWSIRWVAGLFALLMVAAGAIPASGASDTDESLLGSERGVLHAVADNDQRATAGELRAFASELLGSKSGSESEGEIEEHDLDPSCSPTAPQSTFPRLPSLAPQLGNRSPRSTEAACRLAPRAPPLA